MNCFKLLSLLFSFLIFECASSNKIGTDIIPVEPIETHVVNTNCASIISNNFIIAVQELKNNQLEDILKNNTLVNKNGIFQLLRMPKLTFIIILIENTGNLPLEIGDIKLQYNTIFSNQLIPEELINRYVNPPYSLLNFNEIFSLYKIDTDELCDTEIDFKEELKKYKGPIVPGDKAFKITAFDFIPFEIRKFNLSVVVKSDIIKKIIDFKLMRTEYRQSGTHFSKPEVEDNFH
jgi:hypothetical protein